MFVLNNIMQMISSILGANASYGMVALLKALYQAYQMDVGGRSADVDEHSRWVQTIAENELYRYLSGKRTAKRINNEQPIKTEVVRNDDGQMMGYVVFIPLLHTQRTPRTRVKRWFRYRIPHIVLWFSFGDYYTSDVRSRTYGIQRDDSQGVSEIDLVLCDDVSRDDYDWLNVAISALWGGWYSAITHTHND